MKASSRQAIWHTRPAVDDAVEVIAAGTGLSTVAARVLVARGMTTVEEATRFLTPSLERDWHDPLSIPGMREAALAVAEAVRAGRRILVFGDFDLDGVSAAAVAARGLRELGAHVDVMVPHRFDEGYGLSAAAIERAMGFQPELVVTVDCGISSGAEVAVLKERGIDVVITDHHEPGTGVPEGVPIANPKLEADCPSRDLAGAGVALKLVQATADALGAPASWHELVDLATLGTIADVVPLLGENRALVAAGIERIRRHARQPIAALGAVAGVAVERLTSDNIAFALAPRLNAAGRLADATLALDLLMCEDPLEAERLAGKLDVLNRTRQEIESELASAASAVAERTWSGQRAIVVAGEGWHEGVKGIVASRLTNAYRVPALLFTVENGVARGSGRSVGSVDLFAALEKCADLLDRFGGHRAAVGLQLPAERLEEFRGRLLAVLDALPDEEFESPLNVDAEVALDELGVELGEELAGLEPFGHGNPRPMFAASRVFMTERARVGKGEDHLRFKAFDGIATLPAIAFRCRDISRMAVHDAPVDLAFQLEVDEWRGVKRAQLMVRDVHERDLSAEAPAADLVEDLFLRADELLAREEYAGIEDAASFHTKLAGVTFEGRQDVLTRLDPGTPLRLQRQPENPYDTNACALFDPRGDQVGFLNRRLAGVLAPVLDRQVEYDVEVSEVTGGEGGRSLGVNVVMVRRDLAANDEDLAELRASRRLELAGLEASELDAELAKAFLGDRLLHDAQKQALDHLAAGRSTLCVMATGRGKSLIFHMHAARAALRDACASVFVYPLRALVSDQAFHLEESLGRIGMSVCVLTGESSPTHRDEVFASLAAGELDVVLTTPEFLDIHARRFAQTGRIGFVVVDEAHHVGLARQGHRPSYSRLGAAVETLGGPLVLAVTATASDDVAETICRDLRIESRVLDATVRDNLIVEDGRDAAALNSQRKPPNRDTRVAELVSGGEKVIVYVNSRDKTVQIAREMRKRIPQAAHRIAFYNGALSRTVRHAVERAFRDGELDLVVSTSAFGEGVNIPDVRHVVLYHLPFSEVEFNQMSGRAGRDGAAARVHMLFGEKDAKINTLILEAGAPAPEDMRDVYRVLREMKLNDEGMIEITNAEIAEAARAVRNTRMSRGERSKDGSVLARFSLDERGVSATLGILRELGFVTGEGHGAYRRLSIVAPPPKAELTDSIRYREGLDEIDEFEAFRSWALSATSDDLLARFNRPILPTSA